MKNYLKTFLSFSKKELNGLVVLFSLLLLFIMLYPLADWLAPPPEADFSAFEKQIAALDNARADAPGSASRAAAEDNRAVAGDTRAVAGDTGAFAASERFPTAHSNAERWRIRQDLQREQAGIQPAYTSRRANTFPRGDNLRPFDPNTASETELIRLGLKENVVRTLLNYRKAGGRFFRKEDLQKIYGLRQKDYTRLAPFIRLKDPASTSAAGPPETVPAGERAWTRGKKYHRILEINSADSAELIGLPGIGTTLSARIVRYRERLGGFHSLEQLLQVYGLDSANYRKAFRYLRLDTSLVRKVNLNQAGYREFSRFPYWSPVQISAVLNYRDQRDGFSEMNDLYQIRALEDSTIQKVIPYLSLR